MGGVVHDYLQMIGRDRTEQIDLTAQEVVVGTSPLNDVALVHDPQASRLHAALRRYPSGWSVRDLGSRNGTFVNGERVFSEQRLLDGDEIRVGSTILVYRSASHRMTPPTVDAGEPAPELTARERDVLVALCRPLVGGDVFTRPAHIKEIAAELVVTEAAARQHLSSLYRKFAIEEGPSDKRRALLANAAISRGAITLGELRAPRKGS